MIAFLKPILATTVTAGVVSVAMDPTVKVAIIAASGNAIVAFGLFFLNWKMNKIHGLVNSQSVALNKLTADAAFSSGRREGVDATKAEQGIKAIGIVEGSEKKENL
jgi:hypothetical protein